MANLELDGKLVRKLQPQSGRSARGDWSKQEFVVEYQDGNFPTSVVLNVWGADKVAELQTLREGEMLRISFRPSSREFNGRWYTDLRAWRIQRLDAQQAAPAPAQQAPAYPADSVPAGFAPQAAPAPTLEDMPAESDDSDDLPF